MEVLIRVQKFKNIQNFLTYNSCLREDWALVTIFVNSAERWLISITLIPVPP